MHIIYDMHDLYDKSLFLVISMSLSVSILSMQGPPNPVPQPSPEHEPTRQFNAEYLVKVVNPARKGEYEVHKLRVLRQFSTVEELKTNLQGSLKDHVSDSKGKEFHVGYIEPGKQGVRGKTRWLFTGDLLDMYSAYSGKSEILLWCDGRKVEKETAQQSKHSSDECPPSKRGRKSVTESQAKKLSDVQEIYEALEEKNRGSYSEEQMHMWAHLIQMGKHKSYEPPPDKPFFRGSLAKAKKGNDSCKSQPISAVSKSAPEPDSVSISPMRRANLRSAYMSQVKDWYAFLEAGAITNAEYEEHKNKILGDLGKLN